MLQLKPQEVQQILESIDEEGRLDWVNLSVIVGAHFDVLGTEDLDKDDLADTLLMFVDLMLRERGYIAVQMDSKSLRGRKVFDVPPPEIIKMVKAIMPNKRINYEHEWDVIFEKQ